ncbi:type ISP restriction/modification enzyme [Streptomyces sp. NPDC005402]|uniref:type ISP restriction/modification enzyme n=1 Tax=Streptomyces sp. NPDC005402 TaxID=3155338 RepID=UPI0033A85B88
MAAKGWIDQIVAGFGAECRQILGHVAEDEAAIRRPVENLLIAAATELGLELHLHPEARRPDLGIRPDLAARVGQDRQRIVGYVELKSPGKADISPGALRGNDRKQWEGMSKLPNLIYTNGQSWMLYRLGQQHGETVRLTGDLYHAGTRLHAAGPSSTAFERLLREFLSWQPEPLRTIRQLVGSIAPLCGLLRAEVVDRLEDEARGPAGRRERPFTDLAKTWENVLFPRTDERDPHIAFADRYAQTVTFALLLAKAERIPLSEQSLHEVGRQLGADHTVMGRALQILTDHVEGQFRNSLDMLVRVIDAVDWPAILQREPDAHIHLYEHFLQEYDPNLRKASGTYYTPAPLVDEMVRLVDEILRLKLDCPEGFADERVSIIDPAMGTGTFLSSIIGLVAGRRSAGGNEGFRAEAVEGLSRRLIGFEKQMAAYAVAQMRIAQTLRAQDADIPLRDLRLHLTDTLADPWRPSDLFDTGGAAMAPLRMDAEKANLIKREERLTVVIGNPPDRERAQGEGGWIESGSEGHGPPLLDRFRLGGRNGRHENKLKNLYVYFWRWATHKVFEQHRPDHDQGIVSFVSTAGFLRGQAFQGMREYLRSTCSEGWIIDLTPERKKQPPISSRFFPGVQRELAVAIFVRHRDTKSKDIAPVHYTALHGSRAEKAAQLRTLAIDGAGWRTVRSDWYAPFTPASERDWDTFPAIGSLLPWFKPGFNPNRTWVVGPDPDVLRQRWERLVHEDDAAMRQTLMKETRDRHMNSRPRPFPGYPVPSKALNAERAACPEPVSIARRSFDRQWLIPDGRVVDYPRPELWRCQRDDQLFIVEQHRQPISTGPALVFTSLVPDVHYFNNNGGRVLPLKHADGSPNTAPGLLEHLANSFGLPAVTVEDLAAYIAGITAHPAFTETFAEDLNSLGVRLPLTADRGFWHEGVRLGRRILWASTFGDRYADATDGRSPGPSGVRQAAQPGITYTTRITPTPLPDTLQYDEQRQALIIGTGVFTGVSPRMRNYEVGHRKVLDHWFAARSSKPTGRIGSPLDRMRSDRWRSEWSTELVDVLSVLRHLTSLEAEQATLLDRVLSGPLVNVAELTRRGVLEPPAHTASPRHAAPAEEMLPGMADVDGLETAPVSPLQPVSEPAPDHADPSRVRGRPRRGSIHHEPT